ncbi:hypothetical protein BH18ACI4_BH18ACI4_05790 [soil metagenome]
MREVLLNAAIVDDGRTIEQRTPGKFLDFIFVNCQFVEVGTEVKNDPRNITKNIFRARSRGFVDRWFPSRRLSN